MCLTSSPMRRQKTWNTTVIVWTAYGTIVLKLPFLSYSIKWISSANLSKSSTKNDRSSKKRVVMLPFRFLVQPFSIRPSTKSIPTIFLSLITLADCSRFAGVVKYSSHSYSKCQYPLQAPCHFRSGLRCN